MFPRFLTASLVFILTFGLALAAEDRIPWPHRSGPGIDGHVAAQDAAGLPVEFDEASGRNILWKTKLQLLGNSTPVIGAGRVWFTSATEDGKQQFVDCIDAESGEVIYHKLLFENADPESLNNNINTYASPSAVLEHDAVYVHFGEYGTAKLNPETADVVWERRDLKCRHFRGPGSSPVMFENLLILTFDGVSAQYLVALNKQTGETVWKTDRTTDYGDLDSEGKPKREGDLRKAYGTPGLVEVDGQTQLVSIGSRAAFGYDALTGAEIWTVRHADFNAAAPPCFFQDLAILNTGDRTANMMAVRLDATTRGDVTETHVAWDRDKGNSRLAAPLLIEGRVFMVTDTGVVTCLDARSGSEVWKDRIGGTHVASPITANGLVYFSSEEGDTTVIRAADTFELVARNHLNEGMRASLAAADGRLYLRTSGHLYCIGNESSATAR